MYVCNFRGNKPWPMPTILRILSSASVNAVCSLTRGSLGVILRQPLYIYLFDVETSEDLQIDTMTFRIPR